MLDNVELVQTLDDTKAKAGEVVLPFVVCQIWLC